MGDYLKTCRVDLLGKSFKKEIGLINRYIDSDIDGYIC